MHLLVFCCICECVFLFVPLSVLLIYFSFHFIFPFCCLSAVLVATSGLQTTREKAVVAQAHLIRTGLLLPNPSLALGFSSCSRAWCLSILSNRMSLLIQHTLSFCCYFMSCCQLMWRLIYELLLSFSLILECLYRKRQREKEQNKRKGEGQQSTLISLWSFS